MKAAPPRQRVFGNLTQDLEPLRLSDITLFALEPHKRDCYKFGGFGCSSCLNLQISQSAAHNEGSPFIRVQFNFTLSYITLSPRGRISHPILHLEEKRVMPPNNSSRFFIPISCFLLFISAGLKKNKYKWSVLSFLLSPFFYLCVDV